MRETIVVFRKDVTGDCFALFPELPSDFQGILCTAYQHVGQHCAADYNLCIAQSDPATFAEYSDLHEELERWGYNLTVCQRATPEMHERRRRIATEWREAAMEKRLASHTRGRSCLLQQQTREPQ